MNKLSTFIDRLSFITPPKPLDDERVNNGLLCQIDQLKSQISHLQEKLNDVQNVVSKQD